MIWAMLVRKRHNAGYYCKCMHGFVGVHYVHMYIYTSGRLKDSSPSSVQVSMHNLKLKTIYRTP